MQLTHFSIVNRPIVLIILKRCKYSDTLGCNGIVELGSNLEANWPNEAEDQLSNPALVPEAPYDINTPTNRKA